MKNILFAAFLMVAVGFASCGNQTKSADAKDSTNVDTTVVDSIDSIAVDTIAK